MDSLIGVVKRDSKGRIVRLPLRPTRICIAFAFQTSAVLSAFTERPMARHALCGACVHGAESLQATFLMYPAVYAAALLVCILPHAHIPVAWFVLFAPFPPLPSLQIDVYGAELITPTTRVAIRGPKADIKGFRRALTACVAALHPDRIKAQSRKAE